MERIYNNHTHQQRFTGIGWVNAIIKFLLESHDNEWKHRCELNFKPKSILHNNELVSFHKRSLLITVDYFLFKAENLAIQKRKWFLDSIEEYTKISVEQLIQWISNTKLLFKKQKI